MQWGGGDLLGKMSRPSNNNNDSLRYVLIKEGMSGSMTSYYERARDSDLLAWGGIFFGGGKRLAGRRLGQLHLGDIFTTGLPQEDVGRYSSS